ncbi:solute carrier family 46 member 3-like [Portunus trituberculatus]|uniref:solute carrier family 46 member 3-like n=1 Tax=Portunus trituberculatus TaxID=210409 RepID=UPI001E1CD999|nr:solute carrier family 46 member 3-like [Portunus trituberculatus]
MMGTITTNLLLDKICREMSFPLEVCLNLTSYSVIEAEVQQRVTVTLMYYNLITSLPSVLFALFLGSWSDRHGRKVPMVLPLLGNVVASLVYVMNAYLVTLPSSYILFAGLPIALTGGMTTLLMACFSYVSDITRLRSRTTRIALVDLGFSLGSPIGILLSSVVFYYVGYLGIYSCGTCVFVIALLYVLVCVRDTRGASVTNEGFEGTTRRIRMCVDLLDTGNVRRSFATAFKRRPHKGRAKVLLLIAAMCLMVTEFGGYGMDYLYTKRMFGWTYNQYVELSVTRLLIQLVVTSIVLPVLSYQLQVPDTVLVLMGCVSKIMGTMVMGVASDPWLLYLSAVISSIGVLPLVITRSLISKTVPGEELGRIFSVLASFESVIPLGSGPLYTAVYNGALRSFPGAIYFLSAGLYVVAACIFVWVFLNRHAPPSPPGAPCSAANLTHTR